MSFSPLPRFDASFNGSLRRLGWEEGRNVVVERRVAQSEATLADLAAQIVQLAPDVIVIPNAGIATVMRRATTTIPIVVLVAGDLVAPGLVETFARPGRNVTELSPCSAVANQALAESSRPRWCHPPSSPSAESIGRCVEVLGKLLPAMIRTMGEDTAKPPAMTWPPIRHPRDKSPQNPDTPRWPRDGNTSPTTTGRRRGRASKSSSVEQHAREIAVQWMMS